MPRRILGKGLHWWGDHLGLIAAPLDSWRGRTQRNDLLIGISVRQVGRRDGVTVVGRGVDATNRSVTLADGAVIEVEAVVWATGYAPTTRGSRYRCSTRTVRRSIAVE